MPENLPKILRAAKISNAVVQGFVEAQDALKTCWVSGYGVLSDHRMAASNLYRAKLAIREGASRHAELQ